MSELHKLQYWCMFIWFLNEPVRVCAPNFLAVAVSPETVSLSLCTFRVFFVFFFPLFCLCVPMCVYVCVFQSTLSNLHTHWLTEHRAGPPPSLCFCRWTAHLVFMKDRGIKTKCQPAVDRFHPPRTQLHHHVCVGAWIAVDLDNEWNKNKSILLLFFINLCHI